MDMQGTPIGNTNRGMKNTSDPRSNDYIREGAGGVASDSLAAESYRNNGGFRQNRDGDPDGVSGDSATWNTTDTSAATKLNAAHSHATRESDNAQSYPEALGGQGSFPGGHSADGYVGGPTGSLNAGRDRNNDDGISGFSESKAGVAPTYTLPQQGAFTGTKPHGKNITEGGFSGEGTNHVSDIGTRDDPGRLALREMEKRSALADPGSGKSQYGSIDNEQPYSALDRDETA